MSTSEAVALFVMAMIMVMVSWRIWRMNRRPPRTWRGVHTDDE